MRFRRALIVVPILSLAMPAQIRSPRSEARGTVELVPQRPLAKDMAAFPRVKSNAAVSPAIAAKINASLQRLDAAVSSAASACEDNASEGQPKRATNVWVRRVDVTMTGPAYLSVQATDISFCGGAHPDGSMFPMVYDLRTGRPVDWMKLLPAAAQWDTDQAADGTTVGYVMWKPLHDMALQHANRQCHDVLQDDTAAILKGFTLALNGPNGILVATAFGLPHAIAACAVPIAISAEEARRLGVSSEVTDALVAARKL